MITRILQLQLTNMVRDAVMEGINKYCEKKNYIQTIEDKTLLANHIISALGLKMEVVYDLVKAGFTK